MLIGIDASRAVIAQRTGTEVYSLHLIRHLLRIGDMHRFCLYFNTPPLPGLIPPLPHSEWRVIPWPRLWTHIRLSAEMLRRPPDVLLVPSHVLPLVHPRRSIVTVHDVGYRHFPQAHTLSQRLYLDWSTRYHTHTAAHILADSQATQADLVRFYAANPARITVVYPGIDPAMRPVNDPDEMARVRQKYRIGGDYILYVGTCQPRKNLSRLVAAMAHVPHVQLVLVGKKGWLATEIEAQAQQLGLSERVVLTGFADEADLPALYSGARLFAMPSLFEGFCFPVLEAMACGAPVACSRTSSLPEVVGDAALTFDPLDTTAIAQTLQTLLENPALAASLIARGRRRAQTFTWDRCASQTLDILERVAASLDH